MKDKKAYAGIIVTGAVIGLIAVALVFLGNPKNMGFCIACFLRDIAGATKLHSAPIVQYFRPEIVGLVGGALIMALIGKEFSPKGGSAPVTRFFLGAFVMIGALVFLGCPLRMVLRIGGGDLNAVVGLVGFAAGILVGIFFLNKGFSLKRTYKLTTSEGVALPVGLAVLFVLFLLVPSLFVTSESGPGSMHAPVIAALIAGLVVGALCQKSRMCMVAGIRDLVLFKDWKLLLGLLQLLSQPSSATSLPETSILVSPASRLHTRYIFGTSWVCWLLVLVRYCLADALCVSSSLPAKATPTLP